VVWQVGRLLGTISDDHQAHIASEDVGEVHYQWICAAATRGSNLEPVEGAHQIVVRSVANTLGWLRALLVSEGEVKENHDLDELLHMYVSGWQILLYLIRDSKSLPNDVKDELIKLLAALTDTVAPELPDILRDGLEHLAGWLSRVGAASEAKEVTEAAGTIPTPVYGPWGRPGTRGWGMPGGSYFTRRGGLVAAVVSDTEAYFAGAR
jgi:hypothetical protein